MELTNGSTFLGRDEEPYIELLAQAGEEGLTAADFVNAHIHKRTAVYSTLARLAADEVIVKRIDRSGLASRPPERIVLDPKRLPEVIAHFEYLAQRVQGTLRRSMPKQSRRQSKSYKQKANITSSIVRTKKYKNRTSVHKKYSSRNYKTRQNSQHFSKAMQNGQGQ